MAEKLVHLFQTNCFDIVYSTSPSRGYPNAKERFVATLQSVENIIASICSFPETMSVVAVNLLQLLLSSFSVQENSLAF